MRDGILNLNKPPGPTSHDVVDRVRRILRERRVGHAGTLDPMASGVLVVGVGKATRVLEYLQDLPKVYRAALRLGVETDTQDLTGAVVREADAAGVTEADVGAALESFRGEILQVPPMYSAVKRGGFKLYDLARRGETVDREPRRVTLYRLELLRFLPGRHPEVELRVECSAGTYIRTLGHDLGRALGVGAALSVLVREAVGPFRLEDSIPLEALRPDTPLIPPAEALAHLPACEVTDQEAVRLAHGQFLPVPGTLPNGLVRVLDSTGRLIAVGRVYARGDVRLLAPEKVLIEHAAVPGT